MESHGYVKRRKNTGYVFKGIELKGSRAEIPFQNALFTRIMHAKCTKYKPKCTFYVSRNPVIMRLRTVWSVEV
jgi:hypothetical protein